VARSYSIKEHRKRLQALGQSWAMSKTLPYWIVLLEFTPGRASQTGPGSQRRTPMNAGGNDHIASCTCSVYSGVPGDGLLRRRFHAGMHCACARLRRRQDGHFGIYIHGIYSPGIIRKVHMRTWWPALMWSVRYRVRSRQQQTTLHCGLATVPFIKMKQRTKQYQPICADI
jgi:hypothetical protein